MQHVETKCGPNARKDDPPNECIKFKSTQVAETDFRVEEGRVTRVVFTRERKIPSYVQHYLFFFFTTLCSTDLLSVCMGRGIPVDNPFG